MKDTDLPFILSKEACDRILCAAKRLGEPTPQVMANALGFFDSIVDATLNKKLDVCYADGSKSHSYSDAILAIQKGEAYEIDEEAAPPRHPADLPITLVPEAEECINRLSTKLNISREDVIHHAACFMNSLVTVSNKGHDVGYIDYESGQFANYGLKIRERIENQNSASQTEQPEPTELYLEAANDDHAPNAKEAIPPAPVEELNDEQYLHELEDLAGETLRLDVPEGFGDKLARSFEDRAEHLSHTIPDDESILQAFLETRVVKETYIRKIARGGEWTDDDFNPAVSAAQENFAEQSGTLMQNLIEAMDNNASPQDLITITNLEENQVRPSAKGRLVSVPSDNDLTDPTHEGNLVSLSREVG